MNYNNQTFSKGLWVFCCFLFNHTVVLNSYYFFLIPHLDIIIIDVPSSGM